MILRDVVPPLLMPFTTERRVEFRDTDAAGIVHFSAFFPMMEAAEHALLRTLGLSVLPTAGGNAPDVSWPRVSASCNYRSAARFEDVLEIEVSVGNIGTSSVRYDFHFRREGTAIADGSLTAVCCRISGGTLEKVPIPELIRERLMSLQ